MTEEQATYRTDLEYSKEEREHFIRDPMRFRRREIILPSGLPWGETIDQVPPHVFEPLDRHDPTTGLWNGATTGERFDHADPLIAASETLRVLVTEDNWELTVRRDVAEQIAGLIQRNARLQAAVVVTGTGFRCPRTGGVVTVKQEVAPA